MTLKESGLQKIKHCIKTDTEMLHDILNDGAVLRSHHDFNETEPELSRCQANREVRQVVRRQKQTCAATGQERAQFLKIALLPVRVLRPPRVSLSRPTQGGPRCARTPPKSS